MRYWFVLFLVLSAQAAAKDEAKAEPVECSGNIASIDFSGNKRTRRVLLLEAISFSEGQTCTAELLEHGRQAIMDLQLFKHVFTRVSVQGDGIHVRYHVKEKYYILPIPRLSRNSDGDLRGGVKLEANNLWGLNHSLDIKSEVERKDDGKGNESFEHEIEYSTPRIIGSDFGFFTRLSTHESERDLYEGRDVIGFADSTGSGASFATRHWLTPAHSSTRLQLIYGLHWDERDYVLRNGRLGSYRSGDSAAVSLEVKWNNVHTEVYRRRGLSIGAGLVLNRPGLGSDFNYEAATLTLLHYYPWDIFYLDNINTRLRLGYSNGSAFGGENFSLGGGDSIRGLEANSDHGFNLFLLNSQFVSAFKSYPYLRWLVFVDAGNVYAKHSFDITELETGIGLGLRWKIRAFVRTDLRLDIGHSTREEGNKVYLGTRLLF